MISILINIVIGFVIGLIARFFVSGFKNLGFILTATIGILGSVLAGILGQSIGIYYANQPAGFIGSIVGSIILLWLLNFLRGGRK